MFSLSQGWRYLKRSALPSVLLLLVACGGGSSSSDSQDPTVTPTTSAISIADCDSAEFSTALNAVPSATGSTSSTPPTLTIHYQRSAADYAGWQIHTWGAGKDPGWNKGWDAKGTDSFGAIYEIPLVDGAAFGASVGYIPHKGDAKDFGGADQSVTLAGGANVIWRKEGDSQTYFKNPDVATALDVKTVRVHYIRYDGLYADWGLHLWGGGGVDVAGLSGVAIEKWDAPVAFNGMPGYALGTGEAVFDIPVVNPKDDVTRSKLEFIIHGMPGAGKPGVNNKDGRSDNVVIDYALLTTTAQIGDVWVVQGDGKTYYAKPDSRNVSTSAATAYWLDKQLLQWPKKAAGGKFKLYYSATGQITAVLDSAIKGADGSIELDVASSVPESLVLRFKYITAGVNLKVKDADISILPALLTKQHVLVQEDAGGKVQNLAVPQIAGALDSLYAAAASVNDLGASVSTGATSFKLWAPTAQKAAVCVYNTGSSKASSMETLNFDAATGVWSLSKPQNLSGRYYKYVVDVFVRGVGVVRNLVTDPYSLSLTTNSARSYVADLGDPALKPAGWDAHKAPTKVAAQEDISIYELHVRDFSINDSTVPADRRGKYLAFAETQSNGMKHLRALANAGLTDVHLLPVYDMATVPEIGCLTPDTKGASADSSAARDALFAMIATENVTSVRAQERDCFNWGYDPFHYTAPEGSYATDPADGAVRIKEFRQMVKSLHDAGLRVGMDVVYNHTMASGQNAQSVLDRVVPGYYQRLNAEGGVENSTCCANTATENLMMGKLMIDSAITWARDYQIDSFRFDLMGHQPRSVMVSLKQRVNAATGRDVNLIGEGWNFGEVADGARFVQASQNSMNGTGIGTFADRGRDRLKGGGCCDDGDAFRTQGYATGLFYDPNDVASGHTKEALMDAGDVMKIALAGSLRDYELVTRTGMVKKGEDIDSAGYVIDPQEVVNYYENHDNRTLWDTLVAKLPASTSMDDRVRIQALIGGLNALSQGIAYYHAGGDILRSKSMDSNSYNSGDWFNRLDWSYTSNNFGVGLPVTGSQDLAKLFLAPTVVANFTPGKAQIETARDMFLDMLKIRYSSSLFRMRTADEIKSRLRFYNTGATQEPTVLAGRLDGSGYAGANFKAVLYFVNVDAKAHTLNIADEAGKSWALHPVQAAATAADTRAKTASYSATGGSFAIPARTAVVFVLN